MDLITLAQEGNIEARNELILRHLGLIKTIMKVPDDIQEGIIKVIKVIAAFRQESGNSLTTVIWTALKRLKIDLFRKQTRDARLVLRSDLEEVIKANNTDTTILDLHEAVGKLHHRDVAREMLAGTPKLVVQKKLKLTRYHHNKIEAIVLTELKERLS